MGLYRRSRRTRQPGSRRKNRLITCIECWTEKKNCGDAPNHLSDVRRLLRLKRPAKQIMLAVTEPLFVEPGTLRACSPRRSWGWPTRRSHRSRERSKTRSPLSVIRASFHEICGPYHATLGILKHRRFCVSAGGYVVAERIRRQASLHLGREAALRTGPSALAADQPCSEVDQAEDSTRFQPLQNRWSVCRGGL